jgi:hypothetical protein
MIVGESGQGTGRPCLKLPRGTGFLFGGLCAAVLVLTLTSASLTLSATMAAASSESGHYRLPPPALSLGAAPLYRS